MTEVESDHDRWERQRRRHSIPDNEVPGPVALDAVLGHTPTLVVALLGVRVFSIGIELDVMTRLRRVGAAPDSSLTHHRRGPVRPDGVDDVMRLAVEYPDGRRAEATRVRYDDEVEEVTPILQSTEGSGSETTRDDRYWLTPLPPPGDLTISFSWAYRDMPETRTVIGADTLAVAKTDVTELWPYQPEPEPDQPWLSRPRGHLAE